MSRIPHSARNLRREILRMSPRLRWGLERWRATWRHGERRVRRFQVANQVMRIAFVTWAPTALNTTATNGAY